MDKSLVVVKHNAALTATYKMTLDEQRLMLLCITKVLRCGDGESNTRDFSLRHDEYCEQFNTSYAYRNMKDAARRLQQRIITINEDVVIGGKTYNGGAISVLSSQYWQENEGEILLRFNHDFMPYLHKLTENFTKYGLADIAQMSSTYAIRIYELCRKHQNIHSKNKEVHMIMKVSELRRMFELEKKYKVHSEFRRNVVDKAVEQINAHSPLNVSYTQVKRGRRIDAYSFNIEEKTREIKASSKSSRKIEKTIENIKKAFENGRIVTINSKRLIDLNGAMGIFEKGAMNLYSLLKSGAEVEIKQAEELF